VEVEGTSDEQGRIVAKTTTDGDDLETAEMIQAGLHPTAQQVAANMQAIEKNQQAIAAHSMQLAANKEGIETNQQDIAAHQQIQNNLKDIEENTNRFTALSEYGCQGASNRAVR
jgi:DNA replication protein DnaD